MNGIVHSIKQTNNITKQIERKKERKKLIHEFRI